MMKRKGRTDRLTVSMTPAVRELVERMADDRGTTMTQVIEWLVMEYAKRKKLLIEKGE